MMRQHRIRLLVSAGQFKTLPAFGLPVIASAPQFSNYPEI